MDHDPVMKRGELRLGDLLSALEGRGREGNVVRLPRQRRRGGIHVRSLHFVETAAPLGAIGVRLVPQLFPTKALPN